MSARKAKMLKIFKLIIALLLVLETTGMSQQLSNQVIVPLAGLENNSKLSYSQTVGEPVVEIISSVDYIFTQGFQQPAIKKVEALPDLDGVSVYPNPASDYVYIDIRGVTSMTFKIDIINITGNIIFSETRSFSGLSYYKEPLNMENLTTGFYLIRLTSNNPIMIQTFKIQKI
jgi:hypothetical protein